MTASTLDRIPVRFFIYPADHVKKSILPNEQKGGWTILRKDETDRVRRYLCGISSGMDIDAHGDRMSEECIKSFVEQFAVGKPIALYVNHGQNYTKDIGLLVKAELTGSREFYTEYRIYDDFDYAEGVPKDNIEEATHAWNQCMGMGVYKDRPRQFGFSIEGFIDEGNIRPIPGGGREILYVDLDPGVSLVTKPAYINSRAVPIANAIRKSLNEFYREIPKEPKGSIDERTMPNSADEGKRQIDIADLQKEGVRSRLDMALDQTDKESEFIIRQHELKEAFEDTVDQVRNDGGLTAGQKKDELIRIFDSYKSRMMALYSDYGLETTEEAEPQPTVVTVAEEDEPRADSSAKETTMTKGKVGAIAKIATAVKGLQTVAKDDLNEDAKTILADVIAALQMLQQADVGQETDVSIKPEDQEMTTTKAKVTKSDLLALIKEAAEYLKDPDEANKEEAEPHEEPDGDEGVMKDTVASPGTSGDTAYDDADELVDLLPEVQPEEVTKMLALLKRARAKKQTRKSNSHLVQMQKQLDNIEKAFENFAYGMGLDVAAIKPPEPVQKGVQGNLGHEQLVAALSEILTKSAKPQSQPSWHRDDDLEIRKNSGAIAEDFARQFNIGRK